MHRRLIPEQNRWFGAVFGIFWVMMIIILAVLKVPLFDLVALGITILPCAAWLIALYVFYYGRQYQVTAQRLARSRIPAAHQAASTAMKRAGHTPKSSQPYLDDIGLLVYDGDESPEIARLNDIHTDSTHVRPFVVVNIPPVRSGGVHGILRFNLIDGSNNLRFTSRAQYALQTGPNFITPSTWLPLHDQPLNDMWTLEVTIGQMLLGVHQFGWLPIGGQRRAQFDGDGEIDLTTRRWLDLQGNERVSLDDLLADQQQR
jgi:hypothetical protein